MMKLTANKTKMYELAGAFLGPEVPNIRETELTKYKGGASFNLKFRSAINYNYYCSLYLAACCGNALLQIEKYSYSEDGSKCIVRETAVRGLICEWSANHRAGQAETPEPHLCTGASGGGISQAERIPSGMLAFILFFSVGKKTGPKISGDTGT